MGWFDHFVDVSVDVSVDVDVDVVLDADVVAVVCLCAPKLFAGREEGLFGFPRLDVHKEDLCGRP